MSLVVLGTGCFGPPPEAVARLERVKQQGQQFDRVLDDVEERLLGNQAQMHLWQELGRRHRQVSALACENVSTHVQAMARHLEHQQEKSRRIRHRRIQAAERVSAAPVKAQKSRSN